MNLQECLEERKGTEEGEQYTVMGTDGDQRVLSTRVKCHCGTS